MFKTIFILLGIPLTLGVLTAHFLPKAAEMLKKLSVLRGQRKHGEIVDHAERIVVSDQDKLRLLLLQLQRAEDGRLIVFFIRFDRVLQIGRHVFGSVQIQKRVDLIRVDQAGEQAARGGLSVFARRRLGGSRISLCGVSFRTLG